MTPVLAFGDDGSEPADRCWSWIASHQWSGWDLEVVTAQPAEGMQPVPPELAELHPWQPESPRPGEQVGFGSVTHLTAEVDPRVALIARDWDLVAIGPRGRGLMKRLHLGSTADWLLREPTSPLVIARSPGPVNRVLVADDGSVHARRAIETLVGLPWVDRVSATLLVVDDGRVDTAAVTESAASRLTGLAADVVVRRGEARAVIVEEIDQTTPDLVVMGARGDRGLRRLFLGSSASAVASSTDCSLLVAHAREP